LKIRKGAAHDLEAHRNHYSRTGTNLPLDQSAI
jgi:hypothetical protein